MPIIVVALLFPLASFGQFDVPKLCNESSAGLVWESNDRVWRFDRDFFNSAAPEVIAEKVLQKYGTELEISPWLMQDPTRKNVAMAGYLVQLALAQRLVDEFYPGRSVQEILEEAAQKPALYSNEALRDAKATMKSVRSREPLRGQNELRLAAPTLCQPYSTPGCVAGIYKILQKMDSREYLGASVSLPHILEQLITDADLVQGGAHFALKIMARMNDLRVNKKINLDVHLFDDMVMSFKAVGAQKPNENPWPYLAFYGVRGASLSILQPLANKETLPVFLTLYIFSAALTSLDQTTIETSTFYSLPASVKTNCSYGAPYHFWLSAFLAKDLSKSLTSKASLVSTYLMGKLYEFAGQAYGKDIYRIYKDRFFNIYNVGVQKSVAFNYAGIMWALAPAQIIAVDDLITLQFETARPMPDLSKDELNKGLEDARTRYSWFNRVIASDAVLKK